MDAPSPELDAAAEALYATPLSAFVSERKRLADGLRAAGQRKRAAAALKLPRPTLSAWLANQLFRKHRSDVDALFEAAARIREGALDAVAAQRAALGRLRSGASELLRSDGHAASEQTVARALTTLQAVAAAGGFAPDVPGRLLTDRDPPGFDAMAGMNAGAPAAVPSRTPVAGASVARPANAPAPSESSPAARSATQAREQAKRARREQQEAQRAEAARLAAVAKQHALRQAELAHAERAAEHAQRDLKHLRAKAEETQRALQRAEQAVAAARTRADAAARAVLEARARLQSVEG